MTDTLCSRLEKVVKRLPDKKAIIYFDGTTWRSLSYADFYKRIKSTANYIIQNSIASPAHSLGVPRRGVPGRPRDKSKIAIILENSPEWAIAYFSIVYAGYIAVPIDVQDSSENIKNILIDSEACGVFISDDIFDRLKPAIEPLNLKRLGVKREQPQVLLTGVQRQNWDSPLFTDIASLLYTSGTTAAAKGVILTHKNFISDFDSINLTGLCTENDKMVCCLPLFHTYSFMVTLILPLLTGASIIFTPSLKGEDLLSSIKDNRATIFVGVPELFAMIYKKIDQRINSINILLRIYLQKYTGFLVKNSDFLHPEAQGLTRLSQKGFLNWALQY